MATKSSQKGTQKSEVDLLWVMKYLKDGVYPPGLNFVEKRMVRKRAERFCYLNGELFYLGTPTDQELGKKTRKVLLTHQERWDKVAEHHIGADGTHNGLEKTAEGITAEYHWMGIYKLIKQYIRQCLVCIERHPRLLASTPAGTSVQSEEDAGDVEPEGRGKESAKVFWEQVEMRLVGPHKYGTINKYVLIAVDDYSQWPEAIVLDSLSGVAIAESLMKLFCRYGLMEKVLVRSSDKALESALKSSLALLRKSDLNVQLKRSYVNETDDDLENVCSLVEKFIKKHKNWPTCLDFALLSLRMFKNPSVDYSPTFLAHLRKITMPASLCQLKGNAEDTVVSDTEKSKLADAMMSVCRSFTSSETPQLMRKEEKQVFTQPSPRRELLDSIGKKAGIVTRSRTGNAKPKAVDEDNIEATIPKRRPSASPAETPTRKRLRVEAAGEDSTPVEPGRDETSDAESEAAASEEASTKKAVDLDTYYEAIKQYVQGDGYPDNSSRSFKRLIRDQAKNYFIKEGELYHEVGAKGTLKKIIMTKDERLKLLRDTHLRSKSKSQMLAFLEDLHWKGKLVDCEAFLLACSHSDSNESKSGKDIFRNMAEARKLLQYDTFETYREITNYIIYDVFSDDATSKRLDHLKRQLKNFKMENGELIHIMNNRKHKVMLTAVERQKAISEAHLKKGTHADLTSTFNQVLESCFWFGMKLDVKVYINYCCNSASDNKHLLERYFLFREHFMKEPLEHTEDTESPASVEPGQASLPSESPATNSFKVVVVDETKASSSASTANSEPATEDQTIDQIEVAVSEEGDAGLVKTDNTNSQSQVEAAPPPVETQKVTQVESKSKVQVLKPTLVVKMGPGGEISRHTIIPTQAISQASDGAKKSASDVVTMAAVESILQEPVPGGSETTYTEVAGEEQAGPTLVTSMSQTEDIEEGEVQEGLEPGEVTQTTVEGELEPGEIRPEDIASYTTESTLDTSVDEEDGGQDKTAEVDDDSDELVFDSDDEEEEDEEDFEYLDDLDAKAGSMSSMEGVQSTPGSSSGEKKSVTPRQHFKCSQCDKLFFGPIKFKMHMYKHTGQKPFPCNLCSKKYTNKKSLVIHQRTHSGELPYLCSLCGKRCPSKIALKSHLKCHDGKGGGFPAKCDVCGRFFTRQHLMERHKLHKHTNAQTEFKCSECSKVFGHQRSLKRHYMSAHMGVKNHVCGLCGKAFYRKEYLTGHLIQHGGAAAEGLVRKTRPSTYKPRPSVFNQRYGEKRQSSGEEEESQEVMVEKTDESGVQRIILHQDENGQLRVVDLATEREVKRMLNSGRLPRSEVGETMVVHIEEPGGEQQVVHVEQATEEQVVEVPMEEQSYVEYQTMEERPQEYVISTTSAEPAAPGTQYIFTTSNGEIAVQGNQELIYGQPAVQYEVECVGDVGDEEALSAINLLAQASAQQYETVVSQI